MNVTSTAPATAAAAKAPAKKADDQPQVGAVRSTIADGLRAVGAGYNEATDWNAVTVDKATIYPIESIYGVGKAYSDTVGKIPVVGKTSAVFSVLGFLGTFQGMIAGSLLRAPGELASDLTNKLADK